MSPKVRFSMAAALATALVAAGLHCKERSEPQAAAAMAIEPRSTLPGPPPPVTQPAGGEPTYAVDRGSFHVRGVDGRGLSS